MGINGCLCTVCLMTMVNIWRFPFWKMGHQTAVLKPMVLGIPDFKNPPYKNGGLKHVQIYIYIYMDTLHIFQGIKLSMVFWFMFETAPYWDERAAIRV